MDASITPPISDPDAARMALTFKGLADPTRLKILAVLLEGKSVSDLAQRTQTSQTAVSHHARAARPALVSSRRRVRKFLPHR